MKKTVKISILGIVLLFFILSAAGFLILKTDIWKNILINYANSQLSQRLNIRLEPEGLGGNLLYHIKIERLKLTNLDKTELISLSGVSLTYNLKSLIGPRHQIYRLRIDSLGFSYPDGIDSLLACLPEKNDTLPSTGQFGIENVVINYCSIADSRNPGHFLATTDSLKALLAIRADTIAAELHSVGGYLPGVDESFAITDADLKIYGDTLELKNCRLHNQGTIASLNGRVNFAKPIASQIGIDIADFRPVEKITGLEQVFYKEDNFNVKGQVETVGKSISLDIGFSGQWRGRDLTGGRIAGKIDGTKVNLSDVTFRSGSEHFSGRISGQLGSQLTAELDFDGIDTYSWGLSTVNTDLQGGVKLELDGSFSHLKQVNAKIDLQQSKIEPLDFNRIQGELIYRDGFLAIVDTFRCVLGETDVKIEGRADLSGKAIDARVYFSEVNADLLSTFVKADTLVGSFDGFVEATGSLTAPDLRGWFRGNDFGLPNLKFEESIARFGFVNIQEKQYGDIFIEATNGQTNLIPETVPLTSLIIRFEGDTAVVQLFKAVSNNLDIEAKGNIVHLTNFNLNSIKISRSGNVLQNIDPIRFSWQQDTIALSAVRFRLNDGSLIVSGQAIRRELQMAKVELANLSIDPFNAFIKGSQGVRGTLEGVVAYERFDQEPNFSGELTLKEAHLIGQSFKNIHLKGRLSPDRILIENLSVSDCENGHIAGSGFVTCHLRSDNQRKFLEASDSIALALDFDRFEMGIVNSYAFRNFKIDGKISGQVNVYNYLGDPKMNYDLVASAPVFDKLTGREITLQGIYQDKRLSFTEATLTTQYGSTRGRGYLPCSISIVPSSFRVLKDAPLSMNFSMKTTELDFLTAYLSSVESISGDLNLALSISGTPAHPIRSGNFSVRDAVINLDILENPITGVSGSAVLKDNLMEIISLTGYMKEPRSSGGTARFKNKFKAMTWDVLFPPKIAEDQPNLTIDGTIDFTYFFRPQYDITLKGEELYIRTLLAEQEGLVSGTFTMTGRDSIFYEGEVDVEDFILRNEFAGREEVMKTNEPSKFYSAFNLHLIIPGSLRFKNSQLDGELDGEMWIVRNGDEPFRFSGTLDIPNGSFYYYGWEFKVVNGSISFDPNEFNPTLDIEAQVDLAAYGMADTTSSSSSESEMVTVYLTGYLDNPSLEFESANYSQSDILMFLARAQNIGSEITSQDQLSVSAANVVGMWFERQMERNISRIAGLDDFELRTNGDLLSSREADQWSVMLGRKIAPNLYVRYERTLATESNQQFGLEYRLNRNMSIVGDVNQDGYSINYRYKYRY